MPEPRKPMLRATVPTRVLEHAVRVFSLERYPVRLQVIDAELQRRAIEQRQEARRAA